MNIQEEIRDSVIVNIAKACPDMLNEKNVALADKILKDEAALGVEIKTGHVVMHDDGSQYSITEPLIEVKE